MYVHWEAVGYYLYELSFVFCVYIGGFEVLVEGLSAAGSRMKKSVVFDLVATTGGSSADGVELPTDDCRQPVGITDENSFFYFFMTAAHFLGKFFFD